jgi:hypothetical protein
MFCFQLREIKLKFHIILSMSIDIKKHKPKKKTFKRFCVKYAQ